LDPIKEEHQWNVELDYLFVQLLSNA